MKKIGGAITLRTGSEKNSKANRWIVVVSLQAIKGQGDGGAAPSIDLDRLETEEIAYDLSVRVPKTTVARVGAEYARDRLKFLRHAFVPVVP